MLSFIVQSIRALTRTERIYLIMTFVIFVSALGGVHLITYYNRTIIGPTSGGIYTEGMVGQPIAINPVLIGQNDIDRDMMHLLFAPLQMMIQEITPSNDFKTWHVVLHDNARWSDGKTFGAEDVRFTLRTIQNPETHSPLTSIWTGVTIDVISSKEFRLTLAESYAFFEQTIANLRVIPEHIFSVIPVANLRLSDFNLEPIGTGPYRFLYYDKRPDGFISRYVLERNPYYSGERPFIDSVTILFFVKDDDMIRAFNERKITGFGTSNAELLTKITIAKYVRNLSLPLYYATFFNTNANTALKESVVRKALSLATDRQRIVNDIFYGNATPITGPLVPGIEGYDPEQTQEFDLNNANAMLENNGWHLDDDMIRSKTINRVVTRLEFTLAFPDTPILQKTAALLSSQWSRIGVKLTLAPLSIEERDTILRTRGYHMLMFGNILTGSDLYPFWHSSERFFPGLNLALYQNTRVDTLLTRARQDANRETRAQTIQEASALIVNDAPAVFLINPSYIHITAPKLMGIVDTPVPTPSHRFDTIASWYLRTGRIFQ